MKKFNKLLSILLTVCLLCSAVGVGGSLSASADTTLPVKDGNYVAATDFSILTPGNYKASAGDCVLDTTTEIFTDGILINTGNFGTGSSNSNFHGMVAYDGDTADGKTEFIEAVAYDNTGMRFTLGLNATDSRAGATAIAVRMSNVNIPDSWLTAVQSWNITLNDKDGNSHALMTYSDAGDDVYTYFLCTDDNSITKKRYNQYATHSIIAGRVSGWLIMPLTMYSDIINPDNITSVSISLTSYWGVNTRIYEIGFVSDINDFLGIIEPLENSPYITMATDFSGLTPSETAYTDSATGTQGSLDTNSQIFTDGYMVDDTSNIGTGSGKTNFHGFYARDIDGDSGTDYIEAYPYDNGGMRFTLAMTEEPEVSGEAIAIHIESYFPSSLSSWSQGIAGLTLNTVDGSYALKSASSVSTDVKYYFVNAASGAVTEYVYRNEGWFHLPALYPEGWLIVPLSMFEGNVDTADIGSIKFGMSSYWDTNTRIYGVGYLTDMYAFMELDRPIGESEYLKQANDLSMLTVSSENYIDKANGWNGVLNTESEIFTDGILIDTQNFGFGSDSSNFHGFYAMDTNSDGLTDVLETYPYNNGGMRFTLGLNASQTYSGGDAIAIHVGYREDGTSAWSDSLWIKWDMTLNDKDGNTYELITLGDEGRCAYFIDNADNSVTVRNMDADAYGNFTVQAKKDGWLIVPMAAFEGELDTADIASIKFSVASTWYYNMRISEISIVSDMNALLGRNLGDVDSNGFIEADDLILVRKVLLGTNDPYMDEYLADANRDDKLNILDLIRLKKSLAA